MRVGFIKDTKCFNTAVFDSAMVVQEFEERLKQDGVVDTIVTLPEGFGIGDIYVDGVWTKQEIPAPVYVPTPEERIEALEAAMNFMLGM